MDQKKHGVFVLTCIVLFIGGVGELGVCFYGSRPRLLRAPGLAWLFNLTERDFVACSNLSGTLGFKLTNCHDWGRGEEWFCKEHAREGALATLGRGTTVLVGPLA